MSEAAQGWERQVGPATEGGGTYYRVEPLTINHLRRFLSQSVSNRLPIATSYPKKNLATVYAPRDMTAEAEQLIEQTKADTE